MNIQRRILSLLLISVLTVSITACSGKTSPSGEAPQRFLCIVWPTLTIDFYSSMADVMKEQAEAVGWNVEVMSYDFDSAVQAEQLKDCEEFGVTDIITCAQDPDAVEDICIHLREEGINISMFAMAPANPEAYDSVTVADQYRIGEAIAQNASDWVDNTFPDAGDGTIDAILIEVPADAENIKRAQGMESVSQNSKIHVVHTYQMDGENPEEIQSMMEHMIEEYPETKVVLCHFSSIALAADNWAMDDSQIDREYFGIFSGDWDAELAARIQASVENKSLIRATGTYATDAMEIQFHVCTGEYNRLLNDQKQYVYPVVRITPKNIQDYLNESDGF